MDIYEPERYEDYEEARRYCLNCVDTTKHDFNRSEGFYYCKDCGIMTHDKVKEHYETIKKLM